MAAGTISNFKRYPLGNGGDWLITFTYTGSNSYTASGDVWTEAAISQQMEGIRAITALAAQPMFHTADGNAATWCAFNPLNDGTTAGTFHIYNGVDAHNHNLLITGGQAAGTAVQVIPDSNAGILGKTTASNDTLTGGTSNILTNTAASSSAEAAGTTNYSAYSCQFFGVGRM